MDVRPLFEIGILYIWTAAALTVPVFLIVLIVTGFGHRWLAPWARQSLWSLVLLRLLIPTSVASPLSLQPWAFWMYGHASTLMESHVPEQAANLIDRDTQYANHRESDNLASAPSILSVTSEEVSFNWIEFAVVSMLPWVVLIGMAVVAVSTTIATFRLRRWIRSGVECQRADWLTLLAEGQRLFGVDGSVALRTVPGLTSPATYGWWRPAILLPDDVSTWSMTELRHVFWHELAHIRRNDVALNWVLALIRILHSWNPIFWWAQSEWLAEREMACDALVMRYIDGSQSSDYGRTLLRFLKRMTTSVGGLPITVTPGFVLFLGRKRAIRRRLEQLAVLAKPEGAYRRWLGRGLIVALGVAGLTDAVARPERSWLESSLELPAGTTWTLDTQSDPDRDELQTTVSHDFSEAIDRMCQDDAQLTREIGAQVLQQTLQQLILPQAIRGLSIGGRRQIKESLSVSSCEINGDEFVVTATEAQQSEIRRLMTQWQKHGLRQVSIESRVLTTTSSLKDLLPGAGGQVLNPGSVGDESETGGAPKASTTMAWTQNSVPAFMQTLTPQESQTLINRLQGEPRSNLIAAPKITMFDGQSASINCTRLRPFVTGLRTHDNGELWPEVSEIPEGVKLQMRSELAEDSKTTQLNVRYELSQIVRVEVLHLQTSGPQRSVQIPHVTRSLVNAVATIPWGHSLLIAPLRRDSMGQIHMCLIRPEMVD